MKKYNEFENRMDTGVADGDKTGRRMGCGWTDCTWSVPIPWQPAKRPTLNRRIVVFYHFRGQLTFERTAVSR